MKTYGPPSIFGLDENCVLSRYKICWQTPALGYRLVTQTGVLCCTGVTVSDVMFNEHVR